MTPPQRRAAPARRRSRTPLIAFLIAVLVVGAGVEGWLLLHESNKDGATAAGSDPVVSTDGADAPAQPTESPTPPPFDKTAFSIDDPNSLWVVADKTRQINPQDYASPDLVDVPVHHTNAAMLRQDAADALVQMFDAFKAQTGLEMQTVSAYRSYQAQVSVYNNWSAALGKAQADRQSARPGYSEHQLGRSVDIDDYPASCPAADEATCFAATPQSQWLTQHAWEYGWVLRYPDGKESTTGYMWESWHFRYVGTELAAELHRESAVYGSTITLEEFFGLPASPDYAN